VPEGSPQARGPGEDPFTERSLEEAVQAAGKARTEKSLEQPGAFDLWKELREGLDPFKTVPAELSSQALRS
jgi:hypothetical protein